jgi:hypothetical protein
MTGMKLLRVAALGGLLLAPAMAESETSEVVAKPQAPFERTLTQAPDSRPEIALVTSPLRVSITVPVTSSRRMS